MSLKLLSCRILLWGIELNKKRIAKFKNNVNNINKAIRKDTKLLNKILRGLSTEEWEKFVTKSGYDYSKLL